MILQFERVRASIDAQTELHDLELGVLPGTTATVFGERRSRATFADLALGMRDAWDGEVRFAARDWRALGPSDRAAARGRIGCALDRPSWVSNLDVDENIVLGERYRTGRAAPAVLDEANQLCERLGIETIPAGRPHQLAPATLRQLTVVRALLGARELLILEDLEHAMPGRALEVIHHILDERRADGAAVLWLSGSRTAPGPGAPAAHRLETRPRTRSERNPS